MFIIQDCSKADAQSTPEILGNTLSNASVTAQNSIVITSTAASSLGVIRYDVSVALVTAVNFYLNCIFLHVLCACGVVGNVLNIVILSLHGYRKTSNILLASLSVSDLVFSVTQSVSQMWNVVARFDASAALTLNAIYVVYIRPWNEVALMVSIYQVTLIALVRLLAVCFPLQVHMMVTPTRVKLLTISVYIVLTVMASPMQLMYELHWVVTPGNAAMALYQPSSFYISHAETVNFYLAAILSNARSSVPLTTVSVCSLIIILRLSTSPKVLDRRSSFNPKRAKSIKSVKMLLTMCFILMFLVLLPTVTFEAYVSFGSDKSQLSCRLKLVVQYLSNVLYQFSCSVNFIVYVTMNSKFARTYRQLFCPQKRAAHRK